MKNISLIFNVVLAIAVIVLYVLFLGNKGTKTSNPVLATSDSSQSALLPIAYINIDSLLINYHFAKESNESLLKKAEDSRLDLNVRDRQLQGEMAEFQRKLENNAFLSRERAEEEQARLIRKQQDLQQLNAKLSQELMESQQKMSEQLRDTINNLLKIYNKNKGYQLILSNTSNDNILLGEAGFDITKEIVDLLNERFTKNKK